MLFMGSSLMGFSFGRSMGFMGSMRSARSMLAMGRGSFSSGSRLFFRALFAL